MTILNISVAASSDDAEETSAPSSPGLTSSDLDFYSSSSSFVFVRFLNVTIPPGSTINSCVVRMVPNVTSSDCHDQTIHCEDIDDAPTATTTSGNVSSRDRTSGTAWEVPDVVTDTYFDTVDFASDLQDVIDRVGWASGQDIAVIFVGSTNNSDYSSVYSYNSGADFPQIRIDYTAPSEAIMNQLQGPNLGADLFNGTIL